MNDDTIHLVQNEEDVTGENTVRKIHKILNHNSKEQMYYAYRNAGILDAEVLHNLLKSKARTMGLIESPKGRTPGAK